MPCLERRVPQRRPERLSDGGFSLSGVYWVSAVIVVAFGMGHAGRMAFSNILLLSYVQDAYRGRVMAIYMTEFSFAAVGVFVVGQMAGAIGPQVSFAVIASALIVMSAGAYLFLPVLRRLD